MFTTIAEMLKSQQGANGAAQEPAEAAPKPSAPPVGRPSERKFLRLSDLVLDRRLQQREEIYSKDQVDEISDTIRHIPVEQRGEPVKTGNDEDALEVWNVASTLYVVDGFQRHEAHRREGFAYAECLVYEGTWREAYERSFVVNRHGKQLTGRDKRHKLLNAVEYWHDEIMSRRMSLNELSRRTNLSVAFISKVLRESGIDLGDEITVVRNGQSYTMKTGKIGRPPKGSGSSGGGGGGGSSRSTEAEPPPNETAQEPDSTDAAPADSGETSPQFSQSAADQNDSQRAEPVDGDVQWVQPAAKPAHVETELVLNVPVSLVPELKSLVLAHGSAGLLRALRNQLI